MSFKDYFINKVKEKYLWDNVGEFIRKKYKEEDDYLEYCEGCNNNVYEETLQYKDCLHFCCSKCKNIYYNCVFCDNKINHINCYNILKCFSCSSVQCKNCYSKRNSIYIMEKYVKNYIGIYKCNFCLNNYCTKCKKFIYIYNINNNPLYLKTCCEECIKY